MLNVNPGSDTEGQDYHTHYMTFEPQWDFIRQFGGTRSANVLGTMAMVRAPEASDRQQQHRGLRPASRHPPRCAGALRPLASAANSVLRQSVVQAPLVGLPPAVRGLCRWIGADTVPQRPDQVGCDPAQGAAGRLDAFPLGSARGLVNEVPVPMRRRCCSYVFSECNCHSLAKKPPINAPAACLRFSRRPITSTGRTPAAFTRPGNCGTKKAAALVPNNSRVIEFGAGNRLLERYLDSSCTYMASDLVDRGPVTLICDLNQRPLPDLGEDVYDVAVLLGVLEYVRDVPSVLDWLAKYVQVFVLACAPAKTKGYTLSAVRETLGRLKAGWMNNYREEDLQSLFRERGFDLVQDENWENSAPVRRFAAAPRSHDLTQTRSGPPGCDLRTAIGHHGSARASWLTKRPLIASRNRYSVFTASGDHSDEITRHNPSTRSKFNSPVVREPHGSKLSEKSDARLEFTTQSNNLKSG